MFLRADLLACSSPCQGLSAGFRTQRRAVRSSGTSWRYRTTATGIGRHGTWRDVVQAVGWSLPPRPSGSAHAVAIVAFRTGTRCGDGPMSSRRYVRMESYLLRLRRIVGSGLLASPAVQMVVVDADERILYERRGDSGLWGIPSGAAEPGSSFASAAVAELREEVGLIVDEADLVAFGTLSEPDLHMFTYPNGDQLHAFSVMFEVRRWGGELTPDRYETMDAVFAAAPPGPMFAPSTAALKVYGDYQATKRFQIR